MSDIWRSEHKLISLGVVEKDELLGIAVCSDVVQRTGKFKTQRSSHEAGRQTERGAKSRTDPMVPRFQDMVPRPHGSKELTPGLDPDPRAGPFRVIPHQKLV